MEKKSHEGLVHESTHCRRGPCKALAFYLISPFPLCLLFVGTLLKVNLKKLNERIDRYNTCKSET